MDDQRFDDVSRALGNGGSRRSMLKGLGKGLGAAAVAAVGLSRRGTAEAARRGSNPCQRYCLENVPPGPDRGACISAVQSNASWTNFCKEYVPPGRDRGACISYGAQDKEKCFSCFVAGTRIAMADGTSRSIEHVAVGDHVLGQHGINQVLDIERPLLGSRRLYALNDGPHFVTAEHPFLTEDGWKAVDPAATAAENPQLVVGRLAVGDRLLALAGVAVPVTVAGAGAMEEPTVPRLETVGLDRMLGTAADAATPLYNLRLDGDHAYFANELLVHNK